jgi:hypothetical protein
MLESFWPSNNWRANYERASIHTIVDVDLEYPIIPPYCGLKNMRLSLNTTAYMPFRDLFVGNLILMWPLNLIV